MIRTFPDCTKERVRRLSVYLQKFVLTESGDFVCSHYAQCRRSVRDLCFYEGQLHHVGPHYDLEVAGCPMRIVVVGQEYGHKPPRVSLNERYKMITLDPDCTGFRGRNAHMKGTTTLLRLLFGREPGTDFEGEILMAEPPVHLFDGFALVDFLLCSSTDGETMTGRSSLVMRQNCTAHFRQAIEILEPTVIVAQGFSVREWIGNAFGLPWSRGPIEHLVISDTQTTLMTFAHPSASGQYGWWGQSPQSKYIQETVAPLIRTYLASIRTA